MVNEEHYMERGRTWSIDKLMIELIIKLWWNAWLR